MGIENGWDILLEDPVFEHMEGNVERDDAQRLLAVIGTEFYPKNISVDPNAPRWAVPERQDTIGYKVQAVRNKLDEWLHKFSAEEYTPSTAETTDWLHRFFTDLDFQRYASGLLNALYRCAWNSLPSNPQTTSYKQREQDTVIANVEELEDEIGRAEAARKSSEESKTAAEQAQKAADSAKTTADSIMPNMLTTLGVFIAIVIAVVACYLSLILSEPYTKACPGETPKTLNIVMLLLMGHLLLNIIFLLLYLISKMSVHSLACHCLVGDQTDCQKCDPELRAQCRYRHKLWLRYPYIVAMNGAFVAAYCGFGLWYLVRNYFGTSIDDALTKNKPYAAWLIVITAALMVAAMIFVFQFFLCSPRHKVEAVRKKRQKKEQKAENERKSIRKLQETLNRQETRIAALEENVNQLTTKLEQYQNKKDNASVP